MTSVLKAHSLAPTLFHLAPRQAWRIFSEQLFLGQCRSNFPCPLKSYWHGRTALLAPMRTVHRQTAQRFGAASKVNRVDCTSTELESIYFFCRFELLGGPMLFCGMRFSCVCTVRNSTRFTFSHASASFHFTLTIFVFCTVRVRTHTELDSIFCSYESLVGPIRLRHSIFVVGIVKNENRMPQTHRTYHARLSDSKMRIISRSYALICYIYAIC